MTMKFVPGPERMFTPLGASTRPLGSWNAAAERSTAGAVESAATGSGPASASAAGVFRWRSLFLSRSFGCGASSSAGASVATLLWPSATASSAGASVAASAGCSAAGSAGASVAGGLGCPAASGQQKADCQQGDEYERFVANSVLHRFSPFQIRELNCCRLVHIARKASKPAIPRNSRDAPKMNDTTINITPPRCCSKP